ncbi:MAG: type II toxin-antitoxin system VapC family toxin [Betaproteobacteria bacterium]|nr:type II toxin-antitoxin system VapC family toxin [Betaproteobacteria bacterium]
MRLLLDTHVLIWCLLEPHRLGAKSRRDLARFELAVSAVSLWEMTMKEACGKLPLPPSLTDAVSEMDMRIIPLKPEHVEAGRRFGFGLVDPFDALIVAVAQVEGFKLATRDERILRMLPGAVYEI